MNEHIIEAIFWFIIACALWSFIIVMIVKIIRMQQHDKWMKERGKELSQLMSQQSDGGKKMFLDMMNRMYRDK